MSFLRPFQSIKTKPADIDNWLLYCVVLTVSSTHTQAQLSQNQRRIFQNLLENVRKKSSWRSRSVLYPILTGLATFIFDNGGENNQVSFAIVNVFSSVVLQNNTRLHFTLKMSCLKYTWTFLRLSFTMIALGCLFSF